MRRKQQVFSVHGFEAKWVDGSLVIRARNFRPREETVSDYCAQLRELLILALDPRPDLLRKLEKRQATLKVRAEKTVHALENALGSKAPLFARALHQWRARQQQKEGPPDLRRLFDIVKKMGGDA